MRAPWLAAAGALLLYLPTLAPGLTWRAGGDDAGDLINAAWQLGVPHPTGYPLYTALGRLFLALPWGEPAWRTNLLSAAAGALAAALLAAAVVDAVRRAHGDAAEGAAEVAGAVAGCCLAATPLLWTQATITEVYSLLAAGSAALVLPARGAAANLRATQPAGPPLRVLAFLSGLVLTHHASVLIPLLAVWGYLFLTWLDVLVPSAVGGGAFARQNTMPPPVRVPGRVSGPLRLFGLGLAPLALLPLRAGTAAMADWHHPDTVAGFWALVSGADYHYLLFHASLAAMVGRAGAALLLLTLGAFGPGIILAGLGLAQVWRRDRAWAICSVAAVGLNILAVAVYAAENTLVYALATLPFVAAWLGDGLGVLLVRRGTGRAMRWVLAGLLAASVALGGTAWAASRSAALDPAGQDQAPAFLAHMAATLPPRALLITSADGDTFSLWYDRYVGGRRTDVTTVDVRLLDAPWFRANLAAYEPDLAPALAGLADFPTFAARVAAAGRPVCALRNDLARPPGLHWRPQPAGYWLLGP